MSTIFIYVDLFSYTRNYGISRSRLGMLLTRKIIPSFLILFCIPVLYVHTYGQISGYVNGEEGEPLAFASVYIKSSSTGVTTNADGYYILPIADEGFYEIVCQYLGYRTITEKVQVAKNPVILNFELEPESIIAPGIEISADGEDPAYPIIRRAIKERKKHQKNIESYSCESYIKGRFDIEKVPEAFLEVFIDNMNVFDVDSTGKGIIYLSESESSFHKAPPDKIKEIMHSSLISGFDNQFSFNNAMSMDFSIYDNQLEIIRDIISPIGNSALFYYKYQLLGTTFDSDGRLLNKIRVIPKSRTSPTFSGVIYVTEDLWNVPQGELILTSDHAQQALIDTVKYTFNAVEVAPHTYVDIKKHLWMRIQAFGFKANGGFNGVFSQYNMNPNFDDGFFSREIFKVEESANDKTDDYWESIRPIKLTEKEVENYIAMDSLKIIRKNKLDSIVNNPPKFKFNDIFNGYSRYLDEGAKQFSYVLASEGTFNTVQGFFLGPAFNLRTNPDSFHEKGYSLGAAFNYGFSEKRFRGGLTYKFFSNNDNNTTWAVSAGRYILQYREVPPITSFANYVYSFLDEKNFAKFYEIDAVSIEYKNEWLNGISLRSFAEFGRRRALVNHSDYSWAKADEKYVSNNPLNPGSDLPAFMSNNNLILGFDVNVVFGQRYISYPNRIFKMGSKYPSLRIASSLNYNFDAGDPYIQLELGLADSYNFNVAGDGQWNLTGGIFLLDEPVFFTDYKHFDGNQTRFGIPSIYHRSFHLLPYYSNSSNDDYVEGHFQHHFRGFILDKVPLIRRLKWHVAAGANYLYTADRNSYGEVYVGLENIGIHIFRFLRFDGVVNFDQNGQLETNYMIGLELSSFLNSNNSASKKIRTRF